MSTTPDFKTFDEFLEFHKEDSMQLDFEKLEYRAFIKLQEQKDKFHHATFESEKEEVREFCEEAIKEIKLDLLQAYRDKRQVTFIGTPGSYKIAINAYFQYLDLYQEIIKTQVQVKPGNQKKQTFEEFLFKITDKENFIQELKDLFPTEKGKSIRAMIELLKDEGLLTYGTKEFKDLYKGIKHSFNRNIGTYQSVKDPKKADLYNDIETMSQVRSKLTQLISKYKHT